MVELFAHTMPAQAKAFFMHDVMTCRPVLLCALVGVLNMPNVYYADFNISDHVQGALEAKKNKGSHRSGNSCRSVWRENDIDILKGS